LNWKTGFSGGGLHGPVVEVSRIGGAEP